MLFVSCAAEDSEVANEVARGLSAHDPDVYLWRRDQPTPAIRGIEQHISQADGFVALLSPDFLADPLCRRERELAMYREQVLRVSDPQAAFVHVLQVREIDEQAEGLPARTEWVDLTSPGALRQLIARLGPVAYGRLAAGPGSVYFRNRSEELDLTVRGLTNFAGPHFWLMIAPPQLGKTWFLDRLAAALALEENNPWVVKLVDVRDRKAEARADVGSLLKSLFGPDSPTTPEPGTCITIARKILASRRRHLCLIDSAELLAEDTARSLRRCLSEIHNRVSEAGQSQAGLAVVVASRRENEWRGITPEPRLSILKLTEFPVEVVEDALVELAQEMGHWFDNAAFHRHASHVHEISEGLPALLARCTAWIRDQNWAGMERLGTQALFEELAHPYIRNSLLASESLLPSRPGERRSPDGGRSPRSRALENAFRVLAPYRLFTQSHLLHYRDIDPGLAAAMSEAGWSVQDLWRAISGSALLLRPLNEPWQQIPAAIRRLLYRYYYATDAERAAAHREARSFTTVWADQQNGQEQVVGLVECLWHEAVALRLEHPARIEADLVPSARVLSRPAGVRRIHRRRAPRIRCGPDRARRGVPEGHRRRSCH